MKTGLRSGLSYKGYYKGYEASNRWQKNKIRKLEKRIRANEKDTGAVKALEIAKKKTYNRKKPGQKGWFHPQEQRLNREMNSEVETIRVRARNKLDKLMAVYNDKRPSAIRGAERLSRNITVADQLFEIGLINEKRKDAVNTRMERVRRR